MGAEFGTIIGWVFLALAMVCGAVIVRYLFMPSKPTNYRSLMGGGATGAMGNPGAASRAAAPNAGAGLGPRSARDIRGSEDSKDEQLKTKIGRKSQIVHKKFTLEEKFFQAGLFSDDEKKDFFRLKMLAPIIGAPVLGGLMATVSWDFALIGLAVGVACGYQLPLTILDRKIKRRSEEIMFYLPLVIEQIAIGVSSSLDIGPCLQRVVSMADERDTHNVVTELLRHAQFHVKSGAGLEDALTEIGRLSGHTELKHAFLSLSQVAKHGGEITRQLQELADAVAAQRETKIDAKIKKLELEATAPVALVFCGFLVILLIGFGIQITDAFK